MKKIIFITILIAFFQSSLYSQVIVQRGSTEWIEQQRKTYTLESSVKYVVPLEVIEEKISAIETTDFTQIIGIEIDMPIDVLDAGIITIINDTLEVRAIEIESKNALFISLIFNEFSIPKGDEMYVYNRQKTVLMGPFTFRNNPQKMIYATDIIEGDHIIIEYHRNRKNNMDINKVLISRIIHGLNPLLIDNFTEATRDANDCFVDVNCPEGDGWDDQKNGTCYILKLGDPSNPNTSGSPWASAALINNTSYNLKPYILTACHNTGGSGSNISLWIFRFRYWRNTCNGVVNTNTISYCGGQLLEFWPNSDSVKENDIALVKMLEQPNVNDNLYYCGWNRSNDTPLSSVLLSHPQGEVMKISKSNSVSADGGLWWRSSWYVGGALGVSSGGPLFNENKLIVGVHSGRYYDFCDSDARAGRLSFSWDYLGTNYTALSWWLDPLDTNIEALEGMLPWPCAHLVPNVPIVHTTNITSNTVWASDIGIQGSVSITSGATLTIQNATIKFTPTSSITIHPGGKLILDGGTLTNACPGEMWQGITVLGDPTKPTHLQYQGFAHLLNNGTVENALCGIKVKDGGKVSIDNASFINNKMGVKFEPLSPIQSGNVGSFYRANFVIDNAYFGNMEDFEAHITAHSSGAINVNRSNFSSNAPRNNSDTTKNNGIVVFDTHLSVKGYCTGNFNHNTGKCEGVVIPTVFTGFSNAIKSSHSGISPILNVNTSTFVGNMKGITIKGVNYHKLILNNIFINEFDYFNTNAYGAHISNATGYKITENNFNVLCTKGPPAVNNAIGLWINNSGMAENEVYKNTFIELAVGQMFRGINATDGVFSKRSGLQTLCNNFHKSKDFDILAGDYQNIQLPYFNHSIREHQGNLNSPAGNLFYNNPTVNIEIRNPLNAITYFYGNQTPENPPITTNVTKVNTDSVNGCPSKIEIMDIIAEEELNRALSQYDEWNDEYEYWLSQLLAAGDDDEEYEMLLGMVSYYSALKDNHFNSIIVAVMNIWDEEGDEGESRKQKAEGGKEANWDTFYEKLRYLFSYRNHYIDNLSIAETYMAESNYGEALATLVKMYDQFELTEEQVNELTGLQIYILWLQQLENEQKSIYKLSERELDYLVNYVETHTGRGTVFANNILCELYGICIEAEGGMQKAESNEDEMMRRLEDEIMQTTAYHSLRTANSISLYPNPGKDYITVISTIENCRMELINAVGAVVETVILKQGSNTINTSALKQGIYIYRAITNNGMITGKWVKNE